MLGLSRRAASLLLLVGTLFLAGCGGGSGGGSGPSGDKVSVSVSPDKVTLAPGASQRFAATVKGTDDQGVVWTVSGGSINPDGTYTAPTEVGTYTVVATSSANDAQTARATVTVAEGAESSLAINPPTSGVVPGGTIAFTAVATGLANSEVDWTASAGTIDAAGLFTAPATEGQVTVAARSRADASKSATATVTVRADAAGRRIVVTPATASIDVEGSQQFQASLTGVLPSDIAWKASSGWVSSTGVYTSGQISGPATVTAYSISDPSVQGSASIEVTSNIAIRVSPTSKTVSVNEEFSLAATLTGTSDLRVAWTATGGRILPNGPRAYRYQAPSVAGAYTVRATAVADRSRFADLAVTVRPTLSVSPASGYAASPGSTTQFSATLAGFADRRVTWSIRENGASGASGPYGSIDADGLYTAPSRVDLPVDRPKVTIVASSVADPTVSATATLTLPYGQATILVSPSDHQVEPGGALHFAAALSGFPDGAVRWSATGGAIDDAGDYVAPTVSGAYSVTATSVAAPSRSTTVSVTVDPIPVNVSPKTTTLYGSAVQFTASVGGAAAGTGVTWSVSGGGTIDGSGLFQKSRMAVGTFIVTARSVADPSKSNTARITIPRGQQ